jgi:hypothetical protein
MRLLLIITLQLLFASNVLAQSKREQELIKLEQQQDSLPRSLFLDSTELKDLKLVYRSKTRQIWRSPSKDTKHINQLYDIRIKFESKEAALAFHKKYWKENSEFGPEITDHKIKHKGATEFRVFSGTDAYNKMIAPYGLQIYCYIFVVDEYFVKFYLSSSIEAKPTVIQPYLKRVIKKVRAN